MKQYGLYIDGQWRFTSQVMPVQDKYSGEVFAEIATASPAEVKMAVAAADQASKTILPVYLRLHPEGKDAWLSLSGFPSELSVRSRLLMHR